MKKSVIVLFILTLLNVLVSAQILELNVRNLPISDNASGIEKARKLYNKGEYLLAEALLYTELEKGNFKPNDFLLFANTLNVDDKPSLAKEFYTEYAKASGKMMVNKQIDQLFDVQNTVYDSKRVQSGFSLSNPTLSNEKVYSEVGGLLIQYSKDCDNNLGNATEVLTNLTDMPFGSVAFYNNGKEAVASLLDNLKNTSSLFYFYQKKGKWKKPVRIFVDDNFNYAFPYVDEVNKTLFFSSDKTGGQGGYDIYISRFNGKSFDTPINLGNEINSFGNEINPIRTEGWMYFSSNGHISFGGYDIFKYKNIGDYNAILENCRPLNSKKNELSVLPEGNNKFIVNRESEDKFYLTSYSKSEVVSTLIGNVIDIEGKPIANANVMIGSSAVEGHYVVTDSKGVYVYQSSKNISDYKGKVIAEGYVSRNFSSENGESPSVQLEKLKPLEVIREVVKEVKGVNTSKVLANSVQDVIIPENVSSQESSASRPDRGLYYIILGSSYDYAQAYDFWNKWMPTFNGAEILEYENGLYRIGFYAGNSEVQAVESFNKARKLKKDIWILRPKT